MTPRYSEFLVTGARRAASRRDTEGPKGPAAGRISRSLRTETAQKMGIQRGVWRRGSIIPILEIKKRRLREIEFKYMAT